MNDHDQPRLRRGLAALSSQPPALPWIRPAVERRAARIRQRRLAGASGVLAAAVLAGLTTLPNASPQTLRPADGPLPVPTWPVPTLPVPLPTVSELPPLLPR